MTTITLIKLGKLFEISRKEEHFYQAHHYCEMSGAPQKIMWQFEERLRECHNRGEVDVEWWVPGATMFGIKKYADMISVLQKERNIIAHFKHQLMPIDGPNKVAVFKNMVSGEQTSEKFDLLHVVPPMGPPAVMTS